MKLTPNFNLNEFQSRDGSPMPENVKQNVIELAKALQVIRDHLGQPITITSGYRSPAHNKKVGGAPKSTHVSGKGADFRVRDITPADLAAEIEKLIEGGRIPQGGLKAYRTWVHYDIRGKRARW